MEIYIETNARLAKVELFFIVELILMNASILKSKTSKSIFFFVFRLLSDCLIVTSFDWTFNFVNDESIMNESRRNQKNVIAFGGDQAVDFNEPESKKSPFCIPKTDHFYVICLSAWHVFFSLSWLELAQIG